MSSDPSTSTALTRCFSCGLKVPTDPDGKVLQHDRKTGARCMENVPYTDPAAPYIGFGLALVLLAALPFVIGVRSALSSPFGDAGTGWLVFAGLPEITGVISLCIGAYGLVRKADIAFLISHDRYDASRAQLVRDQGGATD